MSRPRPARWPESTSWSGRRAPRCRSAWDRRRTARSARPRRRRSCGPSHALRDRQADRRPFASPPTWPSTSGRPRNLQDPRPATLTLRRKRSQMNDRRRGIVTPAWPARTMPMAKWVESRWMQSQSMSGRRDPCCSAHSRDNLSTGRIARRSGPSYGPCDRQDGCQPTLVMQRRVSDCQPSGTSRNPTSVRRLAAVIGPPCLWLLLPLPVRLVQRASFRCRRSRCRSERIVTPSLCGRRKTAGRAP